MSEINYSIIIPHKNIPDLLQRCLDSIPRREDIQIIVVDDNSDSSKVDFNHFPGIGEKCVEVYFTKEGKGAGYARNIGLSYAKGKWLLFADADDYFLPELGDVLNTYAVKSTDIDVIYLNSISLGKSTSYTNFGLILNKAMKELPMDDLTSFLRYSFGPPWCKLISHKYLQSKLICFDEVLKHNDTMFSLKVGYYARNILIDKRVVYSNVYRETSISNAKRKTGKDLLYSYLQSLDVACDYYCFIKEKKITNRKSVFFLYGTLLSVRNDIKLLTIGVCYLIDFKRISFGRIVRNIIYFLLNIRKYRKSCYEL